MGVLFTAGASGQINFNDAEIQEFVDDTGGVEFGPTAAAATFISFRSAVLPTDSRYTFRGNFVVDAPGDIFNDVISGTITEIEAVDDGNTIFTLTGLAMSIPAFKTFLAADNTQGFLAAVFAGNDTLLGSDLSDAMAGFAGNDSIVGAGGSDNLRGDAGNDTLDGGGGSDTLTGGAGSDSLIGGDGNDTYVIDSAKDVISEAGAELEDRVIAPFSVDLTLAAFAGIEHVTLTGNSAGKLVGDEFGNMLIGNAAANVIDGGLFNDAVGSDPLDTLIGGAGNDTYIVRETGDLILELPGGGVDQVNAFASYTLSPQVEHLTLMGPGLINGFGNTLGNRIIGTNEANFLEGAAGNDTLTGNGGNDTLDGGTGTDIMTGGKGADQYVVDSLADKALEAVLPGTDRDRVIVEIDNYTLAPNIEDLTLADASLAVNASGNVLGNVIEGNSFSFNTLQGLGGNDTITGGAGGQDILLGGIGNDQLSNGNFDLSDGGDTLVGGAGSDLFAVTNQGAFVADLDAAPGGDIVNLSDKLFSVPVGTPIENWITTRIENGNTVVSIDSDGDGKGFVDTVILRGVSTDLQGLRTVNGALTIGAEGPLATNLTLGKAVADTIVGTALSDHILGLAGNDTLTGDAGHDTLNGGAGIDSMVGGDGSDTYVVDNKADIATESGTVDSKNDRILSSISIVLDNGKWTDIEHVTLTGTAALSLRGSDLANMLIGNSGANVIDFTDANDGVVIDTLIGGLGADTYIVGGKDIIVEYAGGGIDQVKSGSTYELSANVENLTLTGAGDVDGTGNSLANRINGNDGGNELDGGAGADSLIGGKGNDTMYGARLDMVIFAYVDDGAADTMIGGTGNDTYYVGSLADKVVDGVGAGTDTVISVVDYTLGATLENLQLASGGLIPATAARGTGNALGNQITGNEIDNILIGLAGNDAIVGGAGGIDGNDQLLGGDGNDSLTGDQGDTLVGGAGLDLFTVRNTGVVIGDFDAGPGADVLELSAGLFTVPVGVPIENWITTRIENGNTIVIIDPDGDATGFVDAVTLIGVATDLHGLRDVNGAFAGGPAANITSGKAVADTLTGTADSDHIRGLAGNDSLDGLAGHDTLDGGVGVDTLTGGDGSDTYGVDNAKDVVQETGTIDSDHDRLRASISIDLNLAQYAGIEHVTLIGTAALKAVGDETENLLIGNVGANLLDGIGTSDVVDADTLIGGAGNDSYRVDEQDAVIEYTGGGIDTVSTSGSIFLSDNVENLVLLELGGKIDGSGNELANKITGNSSANALIGDAGNDTLTGNAGEDSLDGGTGADFMFGGLNDDSYFVDSTGDKAIETAGKDSGSDLVTSSISYTLGANLENLTLDNLAGDIDGTGNAAGNVILGNDGDNSLSGLAGNDTLDGGNGDDLLQGGAGNDLLRFGGGIDTLAGGAGIDTFTYASKATIDGVDVIFDFNANPGGDLLDISELLVGFDPNTSNLADFVQVTVVDGSTLISIDADGTVNGSDYIAAVSLQGVGTELDGLMLNGALVTS